MIKNIRLDILFDCVLNCFCRKSENIFETSLNIPFYDTNNPFDITYTF